MTRKKEFRTQLSDEEWDLINEIREKNPAIKTAHDVLDLYTITWLVKICKPN